MTTPSNDATGSNARIIYILYLISIALGITGLVGVIMAYVYRDGAPEWVASHYRFQVRTFWIGLLYVVVGALLTPVAVGFLILLFWLVWLIIRCVKGMQYLEQSAPHPNPTSWMFS